MRTPDTPKFLVPLLQGLRRLPRETGWVEFKQNNADPDEIGSYVSALSNSAALAAQPHGYLVWGIEDTTHAIVGTTVRVHSLKKGNEELENWLRRSVTPDLALTLYEFEAEGCPISLLEIPAATHRPVQFNGQEYVRIGSYKKSLKDYPEEEKALWRFFDVRPLKSRSLRSVLRGRLRWSCSTTRPTSTCSSCRSQKEETPSWLA